MGRLGGRSRPAALRAHYRRLSESPPPLPPDYLSYCCCRCGHTQTLKAEDLHAAVGNAFRMAYAAQLQRRREVVMAQPWAKATGETSPSDPTHLLDTKEFPSRPLSGGYVNEPEPRPCRLSTTSDEASGDLKRRDSGSTGSQTTLLGSLAPPPVSTPPPALFPSPAPTPPPTLTPPPLPERSDSLSTRSEAEELRQAPWFQAGIPREIALEVLAREPEGAFMVRESTSKPGCYALSLRVPRDFQPSGMAHYLILRTIKGFKIKGFTKEFPSLTALITHHSVMPELLPCPLSLNRNNPCSTKHNSSRDFSDVDSDPDYKTLADFRRMMADLNV